MKLLSIRHCWERYGAENHMLRVAVGAAKRGVEVHAAFPNTDATASMVRDCVLGGVHYHAFDPGAPAPPFGGGSSPARFLHVTRLLDAVRPDVVQLTVGWAGEAPRLVVPCAVKDVPTLVVFQWAPNPWGLPAIHIWACRWARARRQRWAAVSQQNLTALLETFRSERDEFEVLYNGIEVPDRPPATAAETDALRSEVRRELSVPQTSRLLLTMARLDRVKGHADLLGVARKLVEQHPDIRFVWAGDGPERAALTSLIGQLGLEQHVRVLGYRSDIDRLLGASDLFVYPSHGEGGCSSSIREAMVHRLPIVSSRAGGIPEVLRDGEDALLFDAGDGAQLQSRLSEALGSPAVMRRLADRARQRISEFSAERMVDQYMTVFEALYQRRRVDPHEPHPVEARS